MFTVKDEGHKATTTKFDLPHKRQHIIAVATDGQGGARVVFVAKNGRGKITEKIEAYNFKSNGGYDRQE